MWGTEVKEACVLTTLAFARVCKCVYGTDGKSSRGLRCNWKRREVVIAF